MTFMWVVGIWTWHILNFKFCFSFPPPTTSVSLHPSHLHKIYLPISFSQSFILTFTSFVLRIIQMREVIQYLSLCIWNRSFKMTSARCIFFYKCLKFILIYSQIVIQDIQMLYLFIWWWTYRLLPSLAITNCAATSMHLWNMMFLTREDT